MDIEQKREEIINYLSECFSNSILTLEEYELRLDKATDARSFQELDMIVVDLYKSHPSGSPRSVQKSEGKIQGITALLGSQELMGNWMKSSSIQLRALMGSVECDLTRTKLYPENKIQVYSMMSEVNIFVPRGVALVNSIIPVISEMKYRDYNEKSRPGAPRIEISGVAIMSEIKIKIMK